MTIVNSWLLHKRIIVQKKKKNLDSTQKLISLADFREELGISLCVSGQRLTPERGRPSTLESVIETIRKKSNAIVQPPKDVRFLFHLKLYSDNSVPCEAG